MSSKVISSNTMDPIANMYYSRPNKIYDLAKKALIGTDDVTMVQYVENYAVTRKRKPTDKKQSRDQNGRIVQPRLESDRDVVLDLKYRISPPDPENDKWCAGALALCIPHKSVLDLLSMEGKQQTLYEAFQYYYSLILDLTGNATVATNNSSKLLHPALHKFFKDESDLYHTTFRSKAIITQQSKSTDNDGLQDSAEESNANTDQDLFDPELEGCPLTEINAHTDLSRKHFRPWNGCTTDSELSSMDPWSLSESIEISNNETKNAENRVACDNETLQKNMEFMKTLIEGKNPVESEMGAFVELFLNTYGNDRRLAANVFSESTLAECKSTDQKNAIKLIIRYWRRTILV